jgi:hypothetical protein
MVVARPADVRVRPAVTRARLLGREEQDVVPERADPALDADEDLLEERVAEVRMLVAREQDDAEQLRPAADERASGCARRVVQRASRGEDALPCRRADVAVVVEDAGDGRNRDAAELRDLVDGADFALRSENVFGDDNALVPGSQMG